LRYVNTATRSFNSLKQMASCTDPAPIPKLISVWPLFYSWLLINWPLAASVVPAAFPQSEHAKGIWLAMGAFLMGKFIFGAMLSKEAVKFRGWSLLELYQTARANALELTGDSLQKYELVAIIGIITVTTTYLLPAFENAWQYGNSIGKSITSTISGCSLQGTAIPLAIVLPWGFLFVARWSSHVAFIKTEDANRGRVKIPDIVREFDRRQQKIWIKICLDKAGPRGLLGGIPRWHFVLHKLSLISFVFAMFFVVSHFPVEDIDGRISVASMVLYPVCWPT
jgi:hypothetical protein